jgi:hypothetical protein
MIFYESIDERYEEEWVRSPRRGVIDGQGVLQQEWSCIDESKE